MTRPESWETKIFRPTTLDGCINDDVLTEARTKSRAFTRLAQSAYMIVRADDVCSAIHSAEMPETTSCSGTKRQRFI